MSAESRAMALVVRGSEGEIEVPMFAVPHEDDTVVLRRPGLEDSVEHLGTRTSYTYQLGAFAEALRTRGLVLTEADWAVGNMRLVDAAFAAAGFDRGRQA